MVQLDALIVLSLLIKVSVGGKHFVLNFMSNADMFGDPHGKITVINPGNVDASVNVKTPLMTGVDESFTVAPGGTHTVTVPRSFHMSNSGIENKGISIISDKHVIIQGLNAGNMASDGFVVPAVKDLGTEYTAVTYKYTASSTYQGPYVISGVAAESCTEVKIHLNGTLPVSLKFSGVPYSTRNTITINLDMYQAFQVMVDWANGGDFSGAQIVSNKPIFVQSGAVWSSIGTMNWPDHLADVLPPNNKLGNLYLVIPFKQRTKGDVLKFVASGSPADVELRSVTDIVVSSFTLGAHDHRTLQIFSSTNYYYVTSTNPIMFIHFLKCHQGEPSQNSDPTMIIMPPPSAWKSDYTFVPMQDSGNMPFLYNDINIAAPCSTKDDILLNGAAIVVSWVTMGTTGYCAGRLGVSSGVHRIYHPEGATFSVSLYGQDYMDSYGFHAGETPTDDSDTTTNYVSSIQTTERLLTTSISSQDLTSTVNHPTSAEKSTSDENMMTPTSEFPTPTDNIAMTTLRQASSAEILSSQPSTYTSIYTSGNEEGRESSYSSSEITYSSESENGSTTMHCTHAGVHATESNYRSTIYHTKTNLMDNQTSRNQLLVQVGMSPPAVTLTKQDERLQWIVWFPWSGCSVSCGAGFRKRVRVCSGDPVNCPQQIPHNSYDRAGYNIKFKTCKRPMCNPSFWLQWNPWGPCSVSCGVSVKQRTRRCSSLTLPCPANRTNEFSICHQPSCLKQAETEFMNLVRIDFHSSMKESDFRKSSKAVGGSAIAIILGFIVFVFIMDMMPKRMNIQQKANTTKK